jgi:hypothetical protein
VFATSGGLCGLATRLCGLAICFGATTVTLGSDTLGVVCDIAGTLRAHSNAADRRATAEGTKRLDDILIARSPNSGTLVILLLVEREVRAIPPGVPG